MATNLFDVAKYVQDQGELGRQRKVRNLLTGAASQAYGADPATADAAVRSAIAADPDEGFRLAGNVADDQDRRGQQIYNMARGLKQISARSPEAAKAFYESQLVPGLRRLGFEVQDSYDEARVMPVVDQVLAQLGSPAQQGVQSTKILENGNIGIVTRSGQVVDTGQRASPTTRLIEQEGQVPFLVTTSGGRVGETTQIGGQPQLAAGGVTFTVDPDLPPQVQQGIIEAETQRGSTQRPWTANTPDPYGGNRSTPMPVRTPTAAEKAAEVRQAQVNVDLANYDRQTELEADRAAATTRAREDAERQAEAKAALGSALDTADELTSLIDRAITHPGREAATGASSRLDPRNFLPGTDATNFGVLLDQIKGKSFLQAFNNLKGAGAITDAEGRKATEAIGRLNTAQSDTEFVNSLRELQQVVAAGRDRAVRKAQGSAPAAAAPVRARNPQTGEVVELRNGQWVPVNG